ncbi:hypothetical protein C922_05550 [Plasmodium inui San Antonio 1]|uniref:Uncharacterized protein n=1 Tax=Plasmodium inui San Antonio 1 TaxID=1237626 RepID=W7A4Q1_9APIC|nr:hypothetical protein C922_05550 [Plasmodium inui San Antonio 1]EUD64069.1 hypothetical protein C922_05550 [Plasmodium inui San Antonio 1]
MYSQHSYQVRFLLIYIFISYIITKEAKLIISSYKYSFSITKLLMQFINFYQILHVENYCKKRLTCSSFLLFSYIFLNWGRREVNSTDRSAPSDDTSEHIFTFSNYTRVVLHTLREKEHHLLINSNYNAFDELQSIV